MTVPECTMWKRLSERCRRHQSSLNAPSANYTATVTQQAVSDALTAPAGHPRLKVWPSEGRRSGDDDFLSTHNYVYDTALVGNRRSVRYQRFRLHKERRRRGHLQGRPSRSCWLDQPLGFQNSVGAKTGDASGIPSAGDPTTSGVGAAEPPLTCFTIKRARLV